ncbi:TATA-binding related factor of subunit 20 of mediator complex-domain-containing protein [Blyttiomyces helicus]|uniref:Mediator of RNA polymerase II transcription subunit 20 n=1 Tax=Blyttiomyces helicus TaxID=388810 RepID=A0A4P9WFJ6_9FUNG|nr:TATA-binding related factor of subunit 20 of mediator complex-domain-containing protein [Blyttiomyces helicus]|eukprot:RKO90635.1 TATA-binding related factor of subunit 20 of mediator complex-domain-containing protein [Blyttiomyces helicus]
MVSPQKDPVPSARTCPVTHNPIANPTPENHPSLAHLPTAPTSASALIQDRLSKVLAYRPVGRWAIACRFYRDQAAARQAHAQGLDSLAPEAVLAAHALRPKALYFLTMDHAVGKAWTMIVQPCEGGEDAVVVEVDRELEIVLGKLKNLWTPRQSVKVEGIAFESPEFIVRIGSVAVGSTSRGLLIQAEYRPETTPPSEQHQPRLRALLRTLLKGVPEVSPTEIDSALGVTVSEPEGTTAEELDAIGTEYQSVRLPRDRITKSHEAYQFFKLFRTRSIL